MATLIVRSDSSQATISLVGGGEAILDAEDIDKINGHRWQRRKDNYVYATASAKDGRGVKTLYLHRLIMGTPPGFDTDHINRNPLDNRKENLRIVPHHVNLRNRLLQANNSSGYKGVSWNKRKSAWTAQAKYGNRHINLGVFKEKNDAVLVVQNFWIGVEEAERFLTERFDLFPQKFQREA